MKVHQKLLGITLVTALGVLGLPKGAIAGLFQNGASLNGISMNGMSFNGTNLNGISLNGANLNGTRLNGVVLNGLRLDNGMSFNGAQLNGTSQGTTDARTGLTLSNPNFAGIKVEGGRLVGVK